MKKLKVFLVISVLATAMFGQDMPLEKFRLSITFEPLNYVLKGHSVWLGFRYKRTELGLFSFSIHTKKNSLFENPNQLDIDLQNGLAIYTRFYLQNKMSAPYVGALIGSEKWGIRNQNTKTNYTLKNAFFTPQVGYSWSTLNNRLLINPNFRLILPFNPKGQEQLIEERVKLKKYGFIPGLDLGLGFKFD